MSSATKSDEQLQTFFTSIKHMMVAEQLTDYEVHYMNTGNFAKCNSRFSWKSSENVEG